MAWIKAQDKFNAAGQGEVWQGAARSGLAWIKTKTLIWRGSVWRGKAGLGTAWQGIDQVKHKFNAAGRGVARRCVVW